MRPSLTHIAHAAVTQVLKPGCVAIDATAGNGHDTLFLARQVGDHGWVYAFDIQSQALANTHERLTQQGLAERCHLIHAGHQQMFEQIPRRHHGLIQTVMFNLGYLPGSNKQLITTAETTIPALNQALELLAPGGLISLLVYRDHPGSQQEVAAISQWLNDRPPELALRVHESPGPVLYLLRRDD